jgi:hypothetical protein
MHIGVSNPGRTPAGALLVLISMDGGIPSVFKTVYDLDGWCSSPKCEKFEVFSYIYIFFILSSILSQKSQAQELDPVDKLV